MLSAAGNVLTEGNTVLDPAEMEKLTILRMNKSFMQFMRKEYAHLSKQQFNRTLAAKLKLPVPEQQQETGVAAGKVRASGGPRLGSGVSCV